MLSASRVASPWGDGDFDGGVRSEIIAILSMMLREPVPYATINLGDKIDIAFLSRPASSISVTWKVRFPS
jgi:hypothetical protein